MKKVSYKIEVSLYKEDGLYFWILWSSVGNGWCNDYCDWATTPEQAWEDANNFYKKYKLP